MEPIDNTGGPDRATVDPDEGIRIGRGQLMTFDSRLEGSLSAPVES